MTTNTTTRLIDLTKFIEYVAWKAEQQFFFTNESFPVDIIRVSQIVRAAFIDSIGQYNPNLGIPSGFAETVVTRNLRALRTISEVFSPIVGLDHFEEWIDTHVYIPLERELQLITNGMSVMSCVTHPGTCIYIIGLSS